MRTQGSPCISNAASSFVGPSSDMDALTKSQDDWLSEWKELTGNLFYWEFVNERVFTASLLPWLTLICRADQKRFAKSGSALNQGRTRRAKK